MEEAIGRLYKAGKTRFLSKATLEVEDFVRRLLEDDSDLYQDEIARIGPAAAQRAKAHFRHSRYIIDGGDT